MKATDSYKSWHLRPALKCVGLCRRWLIWPLSLDPVFDVVTWCWGVCFNHNPSEERWDRSSWSRRRLSHSSWVPDQGTKLVLADPREVVQGPGACPDTQASLIGRRERVYLLPVTRSLATASGWLTFDRYGISDMPRGCVWVWMSSYWC